MVSSIHDVGMFLRSRIGGCRGQSCSGSAIIIALAKNEKPPVFWAAWGKGITIRPYLVKSLRNLIDEVQLLNGIYSRDPNVADMFKSMLNDWVCSGE